MPARLTAASTFSPSDGAQRSEDRRGPQVMALDRTAGRPALPATTDTARNDLAVNHRPARDTGRRPTAPNDTIPGQQTLC